MTDTRIARRYASAIFALGENEGKTANAKRGETLKALDSLLDESPALDRVFKSPIISVAEKKKIVGDLLDKLDADAVTIVQAFSKKLDEAQQIIRGKLTTAIALSAAKQKAVKADLEKKAGKAIELSFDVDKSILGGVVLTVGDRVLDASLRAQLEILRETFKRGN